VIKIFVTKKIGGLPCGGYKKAHSAKQLAGYYTTLE